MSQATEDIPIDAVPGITERFTPTLVRASAGTGKTYQLTARLLRVLLSGAAPETVLATTFTRKAAGEILSRVLLSLAEAAVSTDPGKLDGLRAQVQLPDLSAKTCAMLVHAVWRSIHRLRICTLDSLFSQLARALPFELEMPPGWRLSDDVEDVWLSRAAIAGMIDGLEPSDLETLIAMLSRGDHKRSIEVELQRVVEATYALSRQASSSDVWDTINVPTAPQPPEITMAAGRLRSAPLPQKSLVKQLQLCADHLDARDVSPLISSTLLTNIRRARRHREAVKYGNSKFPSDLDESFDVLYATVRTAMLSLLRAQNQATATTLATYHKVLQQIKQSQRIYSFDDIAVRLSEVFSRLEMTTLDDQLDSAVDHLLLDEFQDTSPVQWRILQVLAKSVTAPGRDASLFCVGDTKQAIYGWRGGVAAIFDVVDQQIVGITSVRQDESHRSSRVVLDSVTAAFQGLRRHPMATAGDDDPAAPEAYEAAAIERFASTFPDHTAARSLPGYVQMHAVAIPSLPRPQRISAAEVMARTLDETCHQIETLHLAAPHLSIGVLTRTNATLAGLIDRLEHRGLDVSAEGGNPLVDSLAVRWVLSALMMVEHPGDGRWRFHVAHSPLASLLPLDDVDESLAADQLRRHLTEQGLPRVVTWLVSGLANHVDASEAIRLQQLVELTTQYGQTGNERLRDFVELVHMKRVQRPRAAAIRVMTVHQSKGLEFDAVFLPELHKRLVGLPPQCVADLPDLSEPPTGMSRSVSKEHWHYLPTRWQHVFGGTVTAQLTEALCLLYVAMTRARQGLYLVTPTVNQTDFDQKTAASLLFHAWQCEADPTVGDALWYQTGDPNWWQSAEPVPSPQPESVRQVRLAFQVAARPPRRNFARQISSPT